MIFKFVDLIDQLVMDRINLIWVWLKKILKRLTQEGVFLNQYHISYFQIYDRGSMAVAFSPFIIF